jgi:glycosyltransferase involved in cell wall biosynthesis
MFFKFLQYISPTWYYNLPSHGQGFYCVDYQKLSLEEKRMIMLDTGYKNEHSQHIDAAFQAFQKGIIKDETFALSSQYLILDVEDNYRFVKKYFHPFWIYYICFIRLLSFKNPIKEFRGFIKSFAIKKNNLYAKVNDNKLFNSFYSKLLNEKPLISVIIPTLNRYVYLNDVLNDFTKQTYTNFKLIIIDQSDKFDRNFYSQFPLNIQLIRQEEKALWLARNTGIENAGTDIIAFSEDDVRIPEKWLENHVKCLDYYQCDISNGVFYAIGSKIPTQKKIFKYAEQFATGNACIYKSVFYKTGMFDRQFEKMRAGDGEFGLRCYLNGCRAISNPLAFCEDVKAAEGGLREMGSWDAFRPKKLFAPRPIPSVLYLIRKYFGAKAACLSILNNVPPSLIPYRYKKNKSIYLIGSIVTFSLFPLIIISVFKSWNISSRMLKEGDKIGRL